MARRSLPTTQTQYQVLEDRIARLEKEMRMLKTSRRTSILTADASVHLDPVQGETVLHTKPLTDQEKDDETNGYQRRQTGIQVYHDGRWRKFADFVIPISSAVDTTPEVDDYAAWWHVSSDYDGAKLQRVEAGLTGGGDSPTVIDVLIDGTSALIDLCQIDTWEHHSTYSSSPVGIDANNNEVWTGAEIVIAVISVGTYASGLSVSLGFA